MKCIQKVMKCDVEFWLGTLTTVHFNAEYKYNFFKNILLLRHLSVLTRHFLKKKKKKKIIFILYYSFVEVFETYIFSPVMHIYYLLYSTLQQYV